MPLDNLHKVEGTNLSYSDAVPLNPDFLKLNNPEIKLVELEPSERSTTGIVGLFLFSNVDGSQKSIGWIVFKWDSSIPAKALLSINYSKTKDISALQQSLPADIAGAIEQSHLFYAMKVDDAVREQGLGKLLFLAGLARMRDKKFKEIQVSGDVTIGQKGSFYSKLGAVVDPSSGNEIISTEETLKHINYLQQAFAKKF